jgi:hypothetical protein
MSTTETNRMSGIDWPTGWERTAPAERKRTSRFDTGLRPSIDDLVDELERIGVDDWRLSTDAEHQKQNPRYPYANARPDDPGAVIRWTMDGEQYAAACDAYTSLADNVRSLYYYLKEKRKMEQRPVTTGESEFANARLPGPEDMDDTVVAERPAHRVLGVDPDADEEKIVEAYRSRVKEAHPDNGGTTEEVRRVREAREELL